MTLDQIKTAVRGGKTVHWANPAYRVINPKNDQWLIICDLNNSCVGLTHADGVTMSEKPGSFFIQERKA